MRKLILTALGLGLCSGLLAAQTAQKSSLDSLRTWFTHLQQALAQTSLSNNYQKGDVTAVAAVRGAQQQTIDPDQPQWKGGIKDKKAAALKKEKAEFAQDVDLILKGKMKEGEAGLSAFEKNHPNSPLMKNILEARAKAQELETASAASGQPNQSKQ